MNIYFTYFRKSIINESPLKSVIKKLENEISRNKPINLVHYDDVIMSAMASQITSLTIVCSLFYSRGRTKKTSKLRVTGLCEGNSSVTDEFPAQMTSNAGKCFDDVIMPFGMEPMVPCASFWYWRSPYNQWTIYSFLTQRKGVSKFQQH